MQKYKVEFVYDKKNDETLVLIWLGTRVVDKRTMNGILTEYTKDKIKKEIQSEIFE